MVNCPRKILGKALERLGFELEDDDVDELAEKFGRRVLKSRNSSRRSRRTASRMTTTRSRGLAKGKEKKLKKAFERPMKMKKVGCR